MSIATHASLDPRVIEDADKMEKVVEALKIPAAAIALLAERLTAKRIELGERVDRAEAEAVFRARGHQLRARILRDGGEYLSSEEVADRLGISRQAVNNKKKRNELIAVEPTVGRGDRYPIWQFEGREVRPWVEELVECVGNGFDALSFLLARRTSLDGKRFLDLAISEDEKGIQEMLALAQRSGDAA